VIAPAARTAARALGLSTFSLCLAVGFLAPAAPASASRPAPVRCDRFAGSRGSDEARGTRRHPYHTVQRLVQALRPGSVGCLLAGTFAEDLSIRRGGRPGKRLVLRSARGVSATIRGRIEIAETANYVTISHLKINGGSSPENTLQVWGDRFKLLHSDINGGHSSTLQSCIYLGHVTYGVAYDAVIDHNRIHDCGTPATFEGHGFYMDYVRGNTRITNNYVYDNDGFGMQLYKDGDNVLVEHNVFDGTVVKAGILFAGETPGMSSDNNTVRHNIFTNNNTFGIDAWWGGPVGRGNVASSNCFWRNRLGGFGFRTGWTDMGGNVFANPLYVNRARKDFRLRAGSPCAKDGPR
jgi:parallel beta-helix repeat protein